MHVVALLHVAGTVEATLPRVASLLGLSAYDVRIRLAGPTPIILLRTEDAARARAVAEGLAALGHDALDCDTDRLPRLAEVLSPREFAFGATALTVAEPQGAAAEIPYDDLLALVRATLECSEETSSVTKTRQLSVGRLLAGVPLPKVKTSVAQSVSERAEAGLFLFSRSGAPPVVLRASRLRYATLGKALGRTTTENFATVVALLRSRAPAALYDERLVSQPRRASVTDLVRTPQGGAVTSASNEDATTLAACLIALGAALGLVP